MSLAIHSLRIVSIFNHWPGHRYNAISPQQNLKNDSEKADGGKVILLILLREYLLGVIVGFIQKRFNTYTFK